MASPPAHAIAAHARQRFGYFAEACILGATVFCVARTSMSRGFASELPTPRSGPIPTRRGLTWIGAVIHKICAHRATNPPQRRAGLVDLGCPETAGRLRPVEGWAVFASFNDECGFQPVASARSFCDASAAARLTLNTSRLVLTQVERRKPHGSPRIRVPELLPAGSSSE